MAHFIAPKSQWPEWAHYELFQQYSHRRLLRAGARLYWWRPKKAKPFWVMVLYFDTQNGDGGIVCTFERKGRKWEMFETGRLRYCYDPARTVLADKIAALKAREEQEVKS